MKCCIMSLLLCSIKMPDEEEQFNVIVVVNRGQMRRFCIMSLLCCVVYSGQIRRCCLMSLLLCT